MPGSPTSERGSVFLEIHQMTPPMSVNASEVAEPAETLLPTYCYSRNQATYVLFLTLLAAGWDEGRLRRP